MDGLAWGRNRLGSKSSPDRRAEITASEYSMDEGGRDRQRPAPQLRKHLATNYVETGPRRPAVTGKDLSRGTDYGAGARELGSAEQFHPCIALTRKKPARIRMRQSNLLLPFQRYTRIRPTSRFALEQHKNETCREFARQCRPRRP
jgi:hypothetical protein